MTKLKKWWTAFSKWQGWKSLLYPKGGFVFASAAMTATGLFLIFCHQWETTVTACLFYPFAAYALLILSFWVLDSAKDLRNRKPITKFREKTTGAFGIGLYMEQFVNFFYGIGKIVIGSVVGSAWIGADGIYNFVQALVQLYQILRHRQADTLRKQWKSYRQCGFLMILLHLTMTGMVFQMIHMNRHEAYTEITVIATAVFSFYKLVKSVLAVAKDRKHKNPVDSAVYFLEFGQALYNLFVLQVGLLWVFGGEDFAYHKLMNTLTGSAVCVLICGIGIYMIWRSQRDMKKLVDTEKDI